MIRGTYTVLYTRRVGSPYTYLFDADWVAMLHGATT